MNRLEMILALLAVLLTGTLRFAEAGNQIAPPFGEPIKLDGNLMESKLIRKVEPVYPERAKAMRLSGKVALVITVNEAGYVENIRVSSGHPALNESAITAVRQWQYSPIFLNGKAVPVSTTVTVIFVIDGDKAEAGSGSTAPPMPPTKPLVGKVIQMAGKDWHFVFRAKPADERIDNEDFRPPQMVWDREQGYPWKILGAWQAPEMAKGAPLVLTYSFIVNEVGELTNFQRIQGHEIPDLEKDISQWQVVAPGLRGSTLVRSSCVVEIRMGISSDEVQSLIKANYSKP